MQNDVIDLKCIYGEQYKFLNVYFNLYESSKRLPHSFILHKILCKSRWNDFWNVGDVDLYLVQI